jgi:hypothetical protein
LPVEYLTYNYHKRCIIVELHRLKNGMAPFTAEPVKGT